VTGSGFLPNGPSTSSVVQINGIPRPTIFKSTLQLTATVFATDIAQPGALLVTVLNTFATGRLTSNAVQLTVSIGPPPSLISVSPEFTMQGADHVRMTLVGANFRPGATVVVSPPLAAVTDSNVHFRAADVKVLSVTVVNSGLMTALFSVSPTATLPTVTLPLRAVDVLNIDGTSTAGLVDAGGTSQPLRLQSSNSLGAPLSVLNMALTHPRDGTLVAQGAELNAEAILAGTGTGTVIGQWVWDGNVVEQFSASIVGGQSTTIRTRQSLPTWYLGLRSPTPLTITAAQNCPPGMAATAACGSGPNGPTGGPLLRAFSPLQGTQGTSVTLTFTGTSFSAPASVQFMPSNGLTVQSTTVTNSNEIQAQVSIAPSAPLGSRRIVLVVRDKTRLPASNTFTVVSGISRGLPMTILRVVPNQIAAGSQNVDLTLQGTNFAPGTQVTFTVGAGVPAAVFANAPTCYVNSTEMHVTVNALPSALPGGRDLNLQTPNQQAVVGKGMLNVLAAAKPSGPPTLLKIPPITLLNFPLGVIKLDAPLQFASQSDEYVTYTVPLLDDASV